MHVRPARIEDAAAIAEVLRRSIVELCELDHKNDPELMAPWIANKTPDTVARWIADETNRMFVTVDADQVLAAGSVTRAGEVNLNYVSPDARFRGASRAMLAALEGCALEMGCSEVRLMSTTTALKFYRDAGYGDGEGQCSKLGIACHPLRKTLKKAVTSL